MGANVTLVTPDVASGADRAAGTAANPIFTATNSLLSTSDLISAIVDTTTAGDTTVVAAAASQTTRVHRLRINVAGAVVVTIKSGATTLEKIKFPGAGLLTYDFATRPWYKTATNTALVINLGAAVQTDAVFEYVRSV